MKIEDLKNNMEIRHIPTGIIETVIIGNDGEFWIKGDYCMFHISEFDLRDFEIFKEENNAR